MCDCLKIEDLSLLAACSQGGFFCLSVFYFVQWNFTCCVCFYFLDTVRLDLERNLKASGVCLCLKHGQKYVTLSFNKHKQLRKNAGERNRKILRGFLFEQPGDVLCLGATGLLSPSKADKMHQQPVVS